MEQLEAEVCVVGAGFAGLAAARRLRCDDRTVVVLEARDRVGGRVWNKTLDDGTVVSVGGTWLGKHHHRMFDLVQEVGMKVYPQYEGPDEDTPADIVLRLHDHNSHYQGLTPDIGWWGLLCLGIAIERLNELVASVPLDRPWAAPRARELDAQTLGAWLGSDWNVPSENARIMLTTSLRLLFSADPASVSLLGALVLGRGGAKEGFTFYMDAGVTETHLVDGGAPEVARRLGEELGDSLRLSVPVRRIVHSDAGVEVIGDGVSVRAKYVIVTAPPLLAGQLEYHPPLPDAYGQLMRQMPPGAIIRVVTTYSTPFWRTKGLTGQTVAPQSPVPVSIDQSPPTPGDGEPPLGVLSSYAIAEDAFRLSRMDPEERRELWLGELAKRLGPEAADPLQYGETDWTAEQWSQGGMIGHFPPGVLTSCGSVLHEPFGRIYWAGTERATLMHGLMEGAVRSGEKAALEIAAKLDEGGAS